MPDPTHPYDRPSDPAKRHSAALTDGPDRAGARSMLKAVGFTDEDLAKPLIGVATTWIETMPCNINQRRLAEFVKEGIRAAGGTPMEFGTVSVSDGVTMGTEGMKASLISREVVADSIELVVRGHLLDGVVCLTGCDKTTPGAAMALGRLDVPGLILYNGTIYPGTYKGQRNATVVSVYEAIGQYRAGKISLDDLYEIENVACPGAGACGGQFTANTMSTAMEFLGISPAGLNGIPAEDPDKDEAARRSGELVMDLVRADRRPSEFVTRASIENAIASVAAMGGSTNGVLHLLAIAHEFGIALEIDEFGAIADRTPIVADMSPGGRYHASDLYDAGGVALVARELLKRDLIDGSTPNVDGRTLGEIAAAAVATDGQKVVVTHRGAAQGHGRPVDPPRLARAGRLRGQARRPRATAPPRAGARLRVGDRVPQGGSRAADRRGRRRRHPQRRAGRRSRHAGDARRDRGARRRGPGRRGLAHHRRPLLRRHPWADDRPHRTRGRARRSDRGRPRGRHDRHRRRPRGPRPGGPGRRDRPPARRVDAARAALHRRGDGEVRRAGGIGVGGRRHDRLADDRQPRRPMTEAGRLSIGIKTSPQAVDWASLEATWARIGEHDVFESVWMNDHLTDIGLDRAGPSWEALTAMAALIHHVPGKWVGSRRAVRHVPASRASSPRRRP